MKYIGILVLLLAATAVVPFAAGRSKQIYHPGDYLAFDVTFSHRSAPIEIGAMLEGRKGMFVLEGFTADGDGYIVRDRIPKDQTPGTYTLREIVVDYGSYQTILTSPVDFPRYKVRISKP